MGRPLKFKEPRKQLIFRATLKQDELITKARKQKDGMLKPFNDYILELVEKDLKEKGIL